MSPVLFSHICFKTAGMSTGVRPPVHGGQRGAGGWTSRWGARIPPGLKVAPGRVYLALSSPAHVGGWRPAPCA